MSLKETVSSVPLSPWVPAEALGGGCLSSSLEEARICHSQDKVSPLPGSQQREAAAHQPAALNCSVLLQPWHR